MSYFDPERAIDAPDVDELDSIIPMPAMRRYGMPAYRGEGEVCLHCDPGPESMDD